MEQGDVPFLVSGASRNYTISTIHIENIAPQDLIPFSLQRIYLSG